MNTWHSVVGDALQALSTPLNGIIQERMAPHLEKGQSWIDILKVLDSEYRRINPAHYSPMDPYCQLRMLSEKLGALGYPFDTKSREVSARAQMLRITRHDWAHNQRDFTAVDALRVLDDAERILRLLDVEDATSIEDLRQSRGLSSNLIERYVEERETCTPPAEPHEDLTAEEKDVLTASRHINRRANEHASPALAQALGDERQPYERFEPVAFGDPEDLENLRRDKARYAVRSAILVIADHEAPVSMRLLVNRAVKCFRSEKTSKKRRARITRQVSKLADEGKIHIDDADFVWTCDVTPDTWTGYRPDNRLQRYAEDISLREIENAARMILHSHGDDIELTQLARLAAREFGFRQLKGPSRTRFFKAADAARTRQA
ncbi:Swt1 family HEPN domain-containing protein [Nesterenkonia suensis]